MSEAWIAVAVIGVATIALEGGGTVVLGGRRCSSSAPPPRASPPRPAPSALRRLTAP